MLCSMAMGCCWLVCHSRRIFCSLLPLVKDIAIPTHHQKMVMAVHIDIHTHTHPLILVYFVMCVSMELEPRLWHWCGTIKTRNWFHIQFYIVPHCSHRNWLSFPFLYLSVCVCVRKLTFMYAHGLQIGTLISWDFYTLSKNDIYIYTDI